MRSMWKGAVSFGLVSIPVNLYVATESKNISFHQVHAADGGRVHMKRVCSVDGEEVAYSDLAKGHEVADGEVVVITDEDLASVSVAGTRAVDVLEFVPLESIDPIYFDKTYYLEPQKNGLKPYLLLRDALHKAGQVAVAKIVLRQRESLAVLRVHSDCLVLSTMLWPDEVRTPDFAFLREDAPEVRDAELSMAGSLIESMAEPVFEADKFTDTYREELQALIDAKVAGREVRNPGPAEPPQAQVGDLMAALTASIEASRQGRTADGVAEAAPTEAPAKKSPAKKPPGTKAPTEKTVATKTVATKTEAKTEAKKTAAKKTAAKKPPARKSAATK